MIVTPLTSEPPFSWTALAVMLIVAAASIAMYLALVRRWTSRRQWVSLAQWSRESGFRLRPVRREMLPQPVLDLIHTDAQVRFHLCDPKNTLVQFETEPLKPGAPVPKWNVLVRHRPAAGAPAALRPATQAFQLIDLLPLGKFPSMTLGDRFVVHASEPAAARRLAESHAAALLPPDLGLVLLERHFMLDFSSRPFDPIEFGRMLALADQLARVVS